MGRYHFIISVYSTECVLHEQCVWGHNTKIVFRKIVKTIYTKEKLGMFRLTDMNPKLMECNQ